MALASSSLGKWDSKMHLQSTSESKDIFTIRKKPIYEMKFALILQAIGIDYYCLVEDILVQFYTTLNKTKKK